MAVIYRTECLRVDKKKCKNNSIRHTNIQGICKITVILGVFLAPDLVLGNPVTGADKTCQTAKKEVTEKFGFPAKFLLDTPSTDQTCGEDSCCSSNLEQEMLRESKHQIDTFLRDAISKLSSLLENRARKFDGHFREMMNQSKHDFHEMFHKTYGKIYLQNSDVFSNFFKELDTYYQKGTVRLSVTLEEFFGLLYTRMFKVINSQYSFDDKYLECVSEHMIDLKPFGDVPHKLTAQLRRSFVATRTFYKALAVAADTARRMIDLRVDEDCERDFVRMHYCGACSGRRGPGACSGYCEAVLVRCLRNHVGLNDEWDKIVDALDKVSDRLVGPYNIEVVVEPLNIKISEAVMIFQENGAEVSKKIYSLCGKPSLSRRKRSDGGADEDDPKFEIKNVPMKMSGHKKRKNNKKHEEQDNNASDLEKLIKEIKMKVRETRQFWAHLPYQFCNNASITAPTGTRCWNGTAVPPKPVQQHQSPRILSEQIFVLQDFSDKLKKAYHGDEVEIDDDDSEEAYDSSGSGSGDFEIEEPEPDINNKVPDESGDKDGFDDANEVPDETPPSTTKPEDTRGYSGGAAGLSLNRALTQYLLPIVLVWFGGAISELL